MTNRVCGATPREAASQPSALFEAVGACRLCAERFAATKTAHPPRPVLQPGPRARLCIASQAPGLRAHDAGRPFEDASGDRLRAWLGLERATFYDPERVAILPMGFCFPGYSAKGADLPPPKICAETWRADVMAAHPRLELILSIGRYSQDWHLPGSRGAPLSARASAWRAQLEATVAGAARIVAMPHPSWRNNAWLKKNPWFEAEALPAIRAAVAGCVHQQ